MSKEILDQPLYGMYTRQVVEGEGLILPCNVEGDSRPTIVWYVTIRMIVLCYFTQQVIEY